MKKSKLIYQNHWSSDRYFYEGIQIQDLSQVKIKNKLYAVHKRVVEVPYDDMGHMYYSRSIHFFIKENVFGIDLEFDLNTITNKVKIVPILFSIENCD